MCLPNKDLLIRKDGNVNSNYKKQYMAEFSNKFPYLSMEKDSFSEFVFHYVNDYTELPLCEQCGKTKKSFISIQLGYRKYCSTTCANVSNSTIQKQTKSVFSENKKQTISNKAKKTNLERYGVENPAQSKDVQAKIKQTNLNRYGVEWTFQSDNNKEKTKNTMNEIYGVDNISQKNMLHAINFLKNKNWLNIEYSVKKRTSHQIAETLNVDKGTVLVYLNKHNITLREHVGYSMKCIQWLESIMKQEQIFIQHIINGGEYKIPGTRFRVDGYCEATNTIYEFHGDCFHGNPDLFEEHETPNFYNNNLTAKELYNKTKERENKIKELGYNLVTIWENDFNQ